MPLDEILCQFAPKIREKFTRAEERGGVIGDDTGRSLPPPPIKVTFSVGPYMDRGLACPEFEDMGNNSSKQLALRVTLPLGESEWGSPDWAPERFFELR
jgi:hypothetical protein